MGLILLIVLVVLPLGGLPRWSFSRSWGYGPTSVIGVLLVILVVLLIFNVIPHRL
jgi:hypothetical protein